MKKYLIGISLVVVLIIGVISVNLLPQEKQLEKSNEEVIKDLNGKNIIVTNSVTDKLLNENFANLVKNSDAVIKGKVLSVKYEAIEGNAWTKVTLHIDDVFKGDVKVGDDIDVYYIGGYITLDEHIEYYNDLEKFSNINEKERDNTILKEVVDGEEEFAKKDEEMILCLVKTSESSPLPKNSYERLYASGMLKLEGNTYKQKYGEIEEKYSIKANEISNIKKMVTK